MPDHLLGYHGRRPAPVSYTHLDVYKRQFQHAAAGQAFSLGHGKSNVTGLAGGVLMNGNQAGAAEPFFKYSAHFRARAYRLRCAGRA